MTTFQQLYLTVRKKKVFLDPGTETGRVEKEREKKAAPRNLLESTRNLPFSLSPYTFRISLRK